MKLLPPTCRLPSQTFLLLTAFLFFNYFVSFTVSQTESSVLLRATKTTAATTAYIQSQDNITAAATPSGPNRSETGSTALKASANSNAATNSHPSVVNLSNQSQLGSIFNSSKSSSFALLSSSPESHPSISSSTSFELFDFQQNISSQANGAGKRRSSSETNEQNHKRTIITVSSSSRNQSHKQPPIDSIDDGSRTIEKDNPSPPIEEEEEKLQSNRTQADYDGINNSIEQISFDKLNIVQQQQQQQLHQQQYHLYNNNNNNSISKNSSSNNLSSSSSDSNTNNSKRSTTTDSITGTKINSSSGNSASNHINTNRTNISNTTLHRHQYRSIRQNTNNSNSNTSSPKFQNDRIAVILYNNNDGQMQTNSKRNDDQQSSDSDRVNGQFSPTNSTHTNTTYIRLGFEKFLEFFQLNLTDSKVDFIMANDVQSFMRHLENPSYKLIIKTFLTNDITEQQQNSNSENNSNNLNENNSEKTNSVEKNSKKNNNSAKSFDKHQKHANSADHMKNMVNSNSVVDLCHFGQGYLKDYNKTVLLWPCPSMKTSASSSNYLPSYEAISFAVKSIAKKLDWTEALILVPDTNWGLPLAISANLDIAYQMEIGSKNLIEKSKFKDKNGKVVIITSPLNDPEIIDILAILNATQHTHILLIDVYATAFNTKISFYQQLLRRSPSAKLLSNIFILTILSERNRFFLDVAFEDEMKSVKNLYHATTNKNNIQQQQKTSGDHVHRRNWKLIKSAIGVGSTAAARDASTIFIPDFTTFKCQNLQKLDENIRRVWKTPTRSSSMNETTIPTRKRKLSLSQLSNMNPFTPVELMELCKSENLTRLIDNASKDCKASSMLKPDAFESKTKTSPSNRNSRNDSIPTRSSHRNNNVDDADEIDFEPRNLNDIKIVVRYICLNSQPDLTKWNQNVRLLKDLIDFFHLYDFIATNLMSMAAPLKTNADIAKQNSDSINIAKSLANNSNSSDIGQNKKAATQQAGGVDDVVTSDDDDDVDDVTIRSPNSNAANQMAAKFNFMVLDINIRCTTSVGGDENSRRSAFVSNEANNYDDEKAAAAAAPATPPASNDNNSNKKHNQMRINSSLSMPSASVAKFQMNNSTQHPIGMATTATATDRGRHTIDMNRPTTTKCNLMWRPFLILEQNKIDLYVSYPIHPQIWDWDHLSPKEIFVRCGTFCWILIGIAIILLLIIIVASVAFGIAVRNYLLRRRLSRGPNKIVLSANDFVFPVENRRVDEGIEAMLCCWLQQLQEFGGPEVDKPDLLKGSIGSLKNLGLVPATGGTMAGGKTTNSGSGSLARHNPTFIDMRARYNGDLVQLKEISMNGSIELKSKAMDLLVMAHGLRHENINPLIGWLSDPSRTAMVFDFCSRGSLQDVLIMDEIKLDWSFRLSLLTDLVRGMRYLHSTPIRFHGSLSSRNCVVDARWVLKITDYGIQSFYESQQLPLQTKSAKELLWTAPELLRQTKGHNRCGTQLGDVYSFGIIMQEVVVRGEPYCMLSLSPEEIINKIKKPPPLIRPSVSKGAAPPEAINIMRQCWAEQPEMRPDFISVYERFKMLNHGRKVNFVDTMFQMLEKYSNNLEELIRERTEQLDIERKKTEQLLNRMLPSSVAEKLKMGLAVDPEEFADVTIYFSDIVGFTTIAAHCSPVQVVDLLNDLYTIFDATINAYNVYKVETIGDAYMVVSGLPVKIPDHAEQIATMALDLLHESGTFKVKHLPGVPLQLRIGLHTGPCCAGVVGLTMPRYCLFGDTVNTASRMESTGSSSRIHMSEATRDRLEAAGGYNIEDRGPIEIKGKGLMNTFWLLGKKGFEKTLPVPPPVGESHGLDESVVNRCIKMKNPSLSPNIITSASCGTSPTPLALQNAMQIPNNVCLSNSHTPRLTNTNSTNPSSSQSSSLAGESVEVKVEITPPTNINETPLNLILPNSYSLDSNTANLSPNIICVGGGGGSIGGPGSDVSSTKSTSPQTRKLSELASVTENLLMPSSFNRMPTSTSSSSSRIYKRFEEIMDLSLPYNNYKCLSPSENNLTQFMDGKYIYGTHHHGSSVSSGSGGGSSTICAGIGGGSIKHYDTKPGSSRLLRRQFSLDKDDAPSSAQLQQLHAVAATIQQNINNKVSGAPTQTTNFITVPTGQKQTLEIPMLQENRWSPKGQLARLHKQNSTSINQDLEKIEEIPMSPSSSSQQHSGSIDSNMNRSPTNSFSSSFTNERQNSETNSNIKSPSDDTAQKLQQSQEVPLNVKNLVNR